MIHNVCIPKIFAVLAAFFTFSSCGPSTDAQYLSRARACFDKGDYECARANYALMSSAQSEIVAADSAFMILDENGASMMSFMTSLGLGGNIGGGLSKLAAVLSNTGGTPGQTKRLNILKAFQKITEIPTQTELRGMVRFLSAMALFSEVLAENASTPGSFTAADLVKDPTACRNYGSAANCLIGGSECGPKISGDKLGAVADLMVDGQGLPTSGTTGVSGTNPTLNILNAALQEISTAALEVDAKGDLGGALSSMAQDIITVFETLLKSGPSYKPDCYRYGLLSKGIGGGQ